MTTVALDEALAAAVAADADEAVDFLARLVRIPSENPPGETVPVTEWLGDALERRGWSVERHLVPKAYARQHGRGDVANLVVRKRFGDGPTVALAAPLDTLPAGRGWIRDPFGAEIRDGSLYGRGARDAKADVAAYVFALAALERLGTRHGAVELHFTADEESGGFLGPAFLLGHALSRPDAVIGSGTSFQVIVGLQGVVQLEVVLLGVQAHAARREDGRDALAAALPILSALYGAPAPPTIGLIEGGRGVNIVPDRVRFTLDRRLDPGEDGETVERELVALVEAAHRAEGVELECRRLVLAEPVTPTAASERLASVISRHAGEAMGRPVPVVSAPVVSGARHYAAAGIATVLYGVGPPIVGEGADFTGEESVSLDLLARCTAAVAAAVAELLRG